MAWTTGLEPATSAVTGTTIRFFNDLQTLRGLPKDAEVVEVSINCGLDWGLEPTRKMRPNYFRLWFQTARNIRQIIRHKHI